MKVLVLGATGMLGHKLVQVFAQHFDTTATVRPQSTFPQAVQNGAVHIVSLDVLDEASLFSILRQVQPDVVVNAVGVVKQIANDPVQVVALNSLLPHRLVRGCKEIGARLIHISTDCVFSGRRGMYAESDTPDALDLYGRSKLLGEVVGPGSLTLRTSIIGREISSRNGLVEWFLSNSSGAVSGYKNVVFSGLPTIVLANLIAGIIAGGSEIEGMFHVSAEPIDKYHLLVLLRKAFGIEVDIEPVSEPMLDRSLDSTAFRAIARFAPPSWPELVNALTEDAANYPSLRKKDV